MAGRADMELGPSRHDAEMSKSCVPIVSVSACLSVALSVRRWREGEETEREIWAERGGGGREDTLKELVDWADVALCPVP